MKFEKTDEYYLNVNERINRTFLGVNFIGCFPSL